MIEKKPRNYIAVLDALQAPAPPRNREADAPLIESATELTPEAARQIVESLKRKYGADLTTEFVVNPELLGGMRIRVGSDVWDSSVRNRLAAPPGNNFNPYHIMSTILEDIETQIAGLKTSTTKSNIGVVRETGDGVARIEGLSDVMLNEMIEFSSGVFGLALNLEETEVGAIMLGDTTQVMEGDEVTTTGKLLAGAGRQGACSVAW